MRQVNGTRDENRRRPLVILSHNTFANCGSAVLSADFSEGIMGATLKQAKSIKADAGGFVMVLRSVGNPDFGQYAPVSEPAAVKGATLASMVKAMQDYCEFWDLGGGNLPSPEVRDCKGNFVCTISYNGRLWDKDDKEVVL